MKRIKKFASLVLAMMMVMAMAIPAMAAGIPTAPTGSITIKDSKTVEVKDKEFKFYRILNATLSSDATKVAYTVPDSLRSFYLTYFELAQTASNDDIVKKIENIKTAADLQKLAKAFAALEATVKASVEANGTRQVAPKQVTYSGLPYGYYLIDDQSSDASEAILMLDTTMPTATITLKANKPTPAKSVDKPATSIGDPRLYTISAPVPNMEGYDNYRFVFNDVLTKGLSFTDDANESNKTGVKQVIIATYTEKTETIKGVTKTVYVPNETLATLTRGTLVDNIVTGTGTQLYDLTVVGGPETTNNTTLTFTLKDFEQYWKTETNTTAQLSLENYENYRVFIQYYATPNEYAVITPSSVPNEVELWYENNPNATNRGDKIPPQPDETDPTGRSEKVTAEVYTTQIVVTKTDGTNIIPGGAQFSITGQSVAKVVVNGFKYVEDADGPYWGLTGDNGDISYTLDNPATPGMNTDRYVKDTTTNEYKKYKQVVATIADAKLGDALDGEIINQMVNATAEIGTDGTLTFKGLGEGTYTIREVKAPDGYNLLTTPIEFEVVFDTAVGDFKIKDVTNGTPNASGVKFENNQFNVTVVNQSGSELPSTGGIGTTIFYVIGGILVIGAGILLVTKKRMGKR